MAGLIGQTLSHYRVTAALGAGGMGEVYRATDTNLGRDVAIKVLPSEVAQDPERLARFQLEAHLLASLNHPHIAAIYGLEEADGKPFLALELVEGEDLKERLQKGAIPVDEAVAIAKQIAEALEEAHERGIVHRDLKPANVKVTPDGKVKVLDFGLAKAWEGPGAVSSDLSQSPTLALTGTAAGLILGTAAYMSPEQARGKSVDKRADIWAFGVVLWEMLTGRKLFAGETVTDTLAAVLKTDVDLEELPAATPPAIRQLLRRCLERQPKNRLHDIADARIAIDEILGGTPVDQPVALAAGFGGRALALVAIAAAVVGALVFWLLSGRGGSSVAASAQMRLSVGLPKGMGPGAGWPTQSLAISPDGRDLVFACVVGNDTQLCRRRLDRYGVEPLEGTVGARQPFFSPDGQWVGFFSRADGLSKVSLATGRVVNLVREIDVATWGFGGWCDDDRIVFAAWNSGLLSVSAEGGAVSTLARSESEWIEGPRCLPGGGTILYRAWGQKGMRIEALRIATGERRVVLEDASQPVFVAPDRLLFTRDRVPMLAPFDPARLAVTGAPTPVSERITITARSPRIRFRSSR